MDESEQSANAPNLAAAGGTPPGNGTQAEGAAGASLNAVRGPIKVRVIDDELDGLTFAHLAAHSAIVDELADLSSPEVAELWSIVISIDSNFKPLADESPETVRQFLGSTRLVQDILLSPQFREKASDSLLDPLANFLQLADNVRTLKEQIKAAFPPTEFETTFAGARPSAPADLLQYDFLILDLVLNKSKGAIDEMVAYLLAMGEESYPAKLPAIIIMSNSAELTTERLRFSTESQISAAGLLLLPKAKIREAGFGKEGLILSYQQLDRQRGVAHHMRVFMRTWMRTLESARSKANTTLWNMDASAMQQIHLSAITEDDPYDEHLNELMSREYLWHVESSPDVATALEALEKCFTEKLAPGSVPPAIGTRFIAPLVNAKVGRDLVSHFTWTGFGVPEALDAKSPKEGRLRHDIATHFLSATVNHMTRVASLKTTRIEVRSANVFLYGKKLADGVPVMLTENDGTPAAVQVALHNKLYFFQDGTSIRLALWIKEQLASVFDKHQFDSAAICNTLSVGLKDKAALTNVVDLAVKVFSLDELKGQLAADRAPDQKVNLVVVESPQAAATVAQLE